MEIAPKILEAVAKVAKRNAGEVRLESRFEELGLDSLDKVQLLFELEEAFDISIPEEQVQGVETIKDIVDRLSPQLAAGRAPAPSGRPS